VLEKEEINVDPRDAIVAVDNAPTAAVFKRVNSVEFKEARAPACAVVKAAN
jgi:hypothetical protein